MRATGVRVLVELGRANSNIAAVSGAMHARGNGGRGGTGCCECVCDTCTDGWEISWGVYADLM